MSKKKEKKAAKRNSSKAASAARNKSKSNKQHLLLAAIIACLGFLLYVNTLGHEYALDDSSVLEENWVTQKGVAGIPTILKTHYRHGFWNASGTLYRPIPLIFFAIQWQIAPNSPGFYHFVNILMYAAMGFMLFLFLARLFKGRDIRIPFIAAALFMAHPVHTEVVANIKSLDEILAFLFSLISLNLLWNYLEKGKPLQLALSVGIYFIALLSKESVVTFVAVIPLLMWFFTKQELPKILKTSAIYIIPVIALLLIRQSILGSINAGTDSASFLDNVLSSAPDFLSEKATAFLLLGKYLLALIFPHPLGSDFGYNQIPITSWGDWRVLLSFSVHLVLGVYALLQLKKRDLVSFGILFYIITFSLFSNLLTNIGSSYGERFLFISSLGFTLVIATLLVRFLGSEKKIVSIKSLSGFFKSAGTPLMIAAVLTMLYSFKTITRNPAWKNSLSLYEADTKVAPNSSKLRYHYGLELSKKSAATSDQAERNQIAQEAIKQFEAAISIYPSYADAYAQGGLVYFRQGQAGKAMEQYESSLKFGPNNAKVYSNMGIIYFQQKNYAKAREVYEKAVSIDPRFTDARRNLGTVYAITQQFDKAIEQFTEGLKYADSSSKAILYYYLGNVYRDKGDPTNSKINLDKARQLDPSLK